MLTEIGREEYDRRRARERELYAAGHTIDELVEAEQGPQSEIGAPTITRDGARIYIDTPLDSPYATRLRRFSTYWDSASARWWVGAAKADALEDLLPLPLGSDVDNEPEQQQQPRSAAALLVDMAREDYTLGVTDTGEPYGIHRDAPHLALMLRGGRTGLRAQLADRYFDAYGVPASQQAIADACLVLEGKAARETPRPVNLRIAETSEGHKYGLSCVHIDMGDPDGHVITIRDGAWEIEKGAEMWNVAPVLFRRTRLTGLIPKPHPDGDYSKLWKFVPISEDDRPLGLAWLVQALIQANTSHPVLELKSEHGSVKSGSAKRLTLLVDPSPVALRKTPRDAEGWVTAANASWVVALDNVSGVIPLWLSDSLCRAVTGDGDVRRALYTDQDVSVIAFRRAVIINGVDIEITQGDLADRLLRVPLPRVRNRLKEEDVDAKWVKEWPDILGGLLTLAAQVHYQLPSTEVKDLPRMADYATVLAAVDAICDTKGLDRYREQAKRVGADTLDSTFIQALMDRHYKCENKPSREILADLTPSDDKWKKPKDWPDNARAVTAQLTRHAPAMRDEGWEMDNDEAHNESNTILWTIQRAEMCNPDSSDSPDSSKSDNRWSDGVSSDGSDDESNGLIVDAANSSDSSTSYDESGTSQRKWADSSENDALSSADESTNQTSQKYGTSQLAIKPWAFWPW